KVSVHRQNPRDRSQPWISALRRRLTLLRVSPDRVAGMADKPDVRTVWRADHRAVRPGGRCDTMPTARRSRRGAWDGIRIGVLGISDDCRSVYAAHVSGVLDDVCAAALERLAAAGMVL